MFTALELARVAPRPRDAFEEILGADLLYGWHSLDVAPADLVSGNVNTLRDRYRGQVLTAPGAGTRPTFGADGSNFHGRSVLGCAARALAVTGLGANLVTGRPCVYVRYRYISNPVAAGDPFTLVGFGVSATSDTYRLGAQGTGAAFNGPNMYMGGGIIVNGPAPADTAVHTARYWLDGTNANVKIDNNATLTAANGASIGSTTAMSIGKAASGIYHFTDAYIAAVLVVRAFPGVDKDTAIRVALETIY